MPGQRFFAERIHGDGTTELIHGDLPITGSPSITDVLSGPPQLQAEIGTPQEDLKVNGMPVLVPGSTAIYFEEDDVIRGGWLLAEPDVDDQVLSLDGSGFCGYPKGQEYTQEYSQIGVDPLDVVRHIWAYLQAFPNGRLGMVLDSTKTPVRLGTRGGVLTEDGTRVPLSFYGQTEPTSEQDYEEDDPFTITWFEPADLGSVIDGLAKETPFEYHEEHYWDATRTKVLHRLELGYPTIGRRRTDLRFVLGENIHVAPRVTLGGGYVNEVTVIGAGEGRAMVRATAPLNDGRLRKAITITDKRIKSNTEAAVRARAELNARQHFADVTSVVIEDTPGTPVGSWLVGDSIRLQAEEDWTDLDVWVRVVGITTNPYDSRDAVCTVVRA